MGVGGGAIAVKVAIQTLFAFIITCPLALQSQLQPAKIDVGFGVVVAVTDAHDVYIPAPIVVPQPVPVVLIVRV